MEQENLSGCDYAEPEWAKENHRLLTEIGEVVDGMVAEGKEHSERMRQLGIPVGFEQIFIGERK